MSSCLVQECFSEYTKGPNFQKVSIRIVSLSRKRMEAENHQIQNSCWHGFISPKWQKVCTDRRQLWVGFPPRSSLAKPWDFSPAPAMLQRRLVYGLVSSCSFLVSLFNELKRFHCKLIFIYFISFLLRSLLSFYNYLVFICMTRYQQVPWALTNSPGGWHPNIHLPPWDPWGTIKPCTCAEFKLWAIASSEQRRTKTSTPWVRNDGRMAGKPS